jgi:hypothetical protein
VDFSFREQTKRKKRYYHRAWQYAKSNSLVFSTLESRLKMLAAHGIKLKVTPEERRMGERAQPNKLPGVRDLPSTWPDSILAHAKLVGATVVKEWSDHASGAGMRFTILYIPRWCELDKPPEMRDWWKPWMEEVVGRHGIEFVDPTEALIQRINRGEEIFYDHFTRAGHEAVAESFLAWYRE